MHSFTHHAYLFEGNATDFKQHMPSQAEVVLHTHDALGFAEARLLKEAVSRRAGTAQRVHIIQTRSITHEAQNALLKVFEEPPHGVVLVLALPDASGVIDTLLSRLVRMEHAMFDEYQRGVSVSDQANTAQEEAQAFLAASPGVRLATFAPFIKEKDRVGAQALCVQIAAVCAMRAREAALQPATNVPTIRAALEELSFVLTELPRRSSSIKMLLEHIALSLPVLKSAKSI